MGEGTFGKVVECWDRDLKKRVAIKIIRAISKYRDAARIEIEVLNTLRDADPKNEKPVIELLSWFDFKNHICMVFEIYGLSLFDFLKKNRYRPFELSQIQDFAKQLLEAVAFLHKLTLIHTDLKPENILLDDTDYLIEQVGNTIKRIPKSNKIRVIDFGSATFESQYHSTVVSTRHYRAPEVILGLGWSYPCDIWSIGCILIELYTGDAIFQTHENYEHLALMERIIGPIPPRMIQSIKNTSKKYFGKDKLLWPADASPASQKHVQNQSPLKELLNPQTFTEKLFFDFILQFLIYEPKKRITAREALDHPFLKEKIK